MHLNSKQKFMRRFENEIKDGYDDLFSKQKFMRRFENEIYKKNICCNTDL